MRLFFEAALVGFLAQMSDGVCGMGYGVFGRSFLLAFGFPPATVTASVHSAKLFSCFASGISNWRLKNIDFSMLKTMLLPSIVGACIGAYILTDFNSRYIEPIAGLFAVSMGIVIIFRYFLHDDKVWISKELQPIGLFGGFFESMGAQGWGGLTATSTVAMGNVPSKSIGTINTIEFFVVLVQASSFSGFSKIGNDLELLIGFITGGIIGAPLAVRVCKKIPARILTLLVAGAVLVTEGPDLLKFFIRSFRSLA